MSNYHYIDEFKKSIKHLKSLWNSEQVHVHKYLENEENPEVIEEVNIRNLANNYDQEIQDFETSLKKLEEDIENAHNQLLNSLEEAEQLLNTEEEQLTQQLISITDPVAAKKIFQTIHDFQIKQNHIRSRHKDCQDQEMSLFAPEELDRDIITSEYEFLIHKFDNLNKSLTEIRNKSFEVDNKYLRDYEIFETIFQIIRIMESARK